MAPRTAARSGRVLVGTSGWSYPHWRGAFFPEDLPARARLSYLAERLSTVEVNGTFYGLTRPELCDGWRRAVPRDFVFAVKASRFITHMLALRSFATPLANFFASGILRLGRQLGPILWQLPPRLRFDRARAEPFFAALPRDVAEAERRARRHDARTTGRAALRAPDGRDRRLRHAVEVRHETWLRDEALALLRAHGVALVTSDTAARYPLTLERTADFAYVRLHGSAQLYASRYTDGELAAWAGRARRWAEAGSDVYVYFDNDSEAHAPRDAARLLALLGRAGVGPRR
jgi:uncharacterized protein YecE (DUF72 family)